MTITLVQPGGHRPKVLAMLAMLCTAVLAVGCGGAQEKARSPKATADTIRAEASPRDPSPGRDSATATSSDTAKAKAWTAGITEAAAPAGLRSATLRAVRIGRHEGFDRVVFTFEGKTLSGYHLEYIDEPVRQCGSGNTVALAGDGRLEVRLSPAQAHTEAGDPTVVERERAPGLPVLRELKLTCDFEAVVTWVLGLSSPHRYRVQRLRDPLRLVVDVQHQ